MTSGIDPEENFAVIKQAAKDAHTRGASMLFTPEMSLLLDRDRKRAAPHIVSQSASPYLKRFVAVAAQQTLCMTVHTQMNELISNMNLFFKKIS